VSSYDLIVVGGGIGGAALAGVMAKAGRSVLLLEQTTVYPDRVRGEWISPWGVVEVRRLGLYDLLLSAGGHVVARHVSYDESRTPQESEARTLPLSMFVAGVEGPLCIGHPHHCQTLFNDAKRSGATALRGVRVTNIAPGAPSSVTYEHEGESHTATAPLIVGADGRVSAAREAAGIKLHQDKPHHWFAGLLVEGATGWPDDLQAIGTENDFGFLAFPQGRGRVRVYGGYALAQKSRFTGSEGPRKFLEAFRMNSAPENRHLADAEPASPLFSYFNNDSWTDEPYAPGVVLVGDAAGWNDPIVGLGLSITYRDVRIVSDILKEQPDWSRLDFSSYRDERRERMRRLRFSAALQATLDMEFGEAARERRRLFHERSGADPTLGMHAVAVMAGPEALPPDFFTDAHRVRVLGQ
jgi:2-polyprenyl-6-methoxyphenol hydroxylase-like FAD-dependent oxidoreductase